MISNRDSETPTSTVTTSDWITPVNLGPAVTAFLMPDACSTIYEKVAENQVAFGRGFTCPASGHMGGNTDYFPPWTATSTTARSDAFPNAFYYSPGISCPTTYSTACMAARLLDGNMSPISQVASLDFMRTLLPGETAIGCCPG
jgi:hypothetical protein